MLPGVDVSRSNETVKFEPPRRWRVGAALVEVVPILTEDEEGGGEESSHEVAEDVN